MGLIWLALIAAALVSAVPEGALAQTGAANLDAVAVIVGNRTYRQAGVPAVEFAHNDAAAMKRFAIGGLGVREGNVIDLRDATLGDLRRVFGTEASARGQLSNWVKSGRSDVLVFYSGHGVPGLGDQRGYLLPSDGDPNLAESTGYALDLLYENLGKVGARAVTVFLDTCFSGQTPKGWLVRNVSGMGVTLRSPEAGAGLTVLTASGSDQMAGWDEAAKHGLFTRHLLLALSGAADKAPSGNGDGRVTIEETKKYLDEEMTHQARRQGREQQATVLGAAGTVLASLPQTSPPVSPPPVSPIALDPIDKGYVVKEQDGARVREQPDVRSRQVTTLKQGEAVHVLGKVKGEAWVLVERGGKTLGYMAVGLLQEAEEWRKQQVAVAPPPPPPPPAAAPAARPVQPVVGVYPQGPAPGTVFRDCADCPEMVVVPAGSFMMGSPEEERRWAVSMGLKEELAGFETPQHRVTIPRSFAVGRYEVTRGEYAAFARETNRSPGDGCFIWSGTESKKEESRNWRDLGFGQDDRHPVACVSWDDAKAYVEWLGRKSGKPYRLLSEAEWEYAARAGTTAARYWGDDRDNAEGCGYANATDQTRAGAHNLKRVKTNIFMCEDGHVHTAPAGSFKANGFGLHDILGNVFEWVEDCWHDSYAGAPTDGSAWTAGGNCGQRVLRGGSWYVSPRYLRAAYRFRYSTGVRFFFAGFRVARTP